MDYTERTWNNLLPGSFNLDLLVTLYGTPNQPLTPVDESGMSAAQFREPSSLPPCPVEEGKKKKDNDSCRRRQLAEEELQALFENEEQNAIDSCVGGHCIYDIDDRWRIEVSQFLAPKRKF
jgi:hypothetical protein